MKKLFLLLTAVVISCNLFGDTDNYTITWDIPTELGLTMNVYVWEGLDTLQCPFSDGIQLDESSPYFKKQVNPYTGIDQISGIADGKIYLSIVGQYKKLSNNLLGVTGWAKVRNTNSHFRLSNDKTPPEEKPENVRIQ